MINSIKGQDWVGDVCDLLRPSRPLKKPKRLMGDMRERLKKMGTPFKARLKAMSALCMLRTKESLLKL